MRPELKLTFLSLALLTLPVFTSFSLTPHSVELEIAQLIKDHPEQARTEFVYDPILHLVARKKAEDLAKRGYFSHSDPDGYGPNKAVTLAGYKLPTWWGTANELNNIESIGAGYASAQSAFDGWMNSEGHRRHLLAEIEFFQVQTRYGIGYFHKANSPNQHYYVVLTAPPSLGGDAEQLEPFTSWLFDRFSVQEIDTEPTTPLGLPRIFEFLLSQGPSTMESLPLPIQSAASGTSSWTLPLRTSNLGSLTYEVQYKASLSEAWSTSGVTKDGDTYTAPLGDAGFWRLSVNEL